MPGASGLAGIQDGANALNMGINNFFNARETWKQSERNYQMTDYLYNKDLEQWNRQNAYNLDMWNMQNEYNSPASQMKRYKEAGLNPNLIYGQGQPGMASPINAADGPNAKQGNMPKAEFKTMPLDFMNQFYDIQLKEQQLQNMQSTKAGIEADTKIKVLEEALKAMDLGFKPKEVQFMLEKMDFDRSLWPEQKSLLTNQVGIAAQEIALKKGQTGLASVEKSLKQKELDFLPELQSFQRSSFPLDLQAKHVSIQNTASEIAKRAVDTGMTQKQMDELNLKMSYFLKFGIWPDKVPWYLGQTLRIDHRKQFNSWSNKYKF